MRIKPHVVVSTLVLLTASVCSLASGGGSMGGGSMGGSAGSASRSPADQAVDSYNQGVREVGKAKDYEGDVAKAGADDKKAAKVLEKAQKSYTSALQDFQKAVDKNPTLFQAWNYVGFCQRHLGHYEDALAAYGKALDLKPNYGEAYEYRAEAYLGLNKLQEAKEAYMQLFATARPLADELMGSMHHWVEARQKDAKGVSSDDLAAFAKWVDERAAIAQQTASLWLGPANKKQVDWN